MNCTDPRARVRTKIVATIGPATSSPDALAALLHTGVDVVRLNFSHGALEEHGRVLGTVREWSRAHDVPIAVLGDLCGPKIRLSRIAGGATIPLRVGDEVRFVRGDAECTPEALTITLPTFLDEVDVGHRIYVDDGLVRLLATERSADALLARCTVAGVLQSRKGVNLPDTRLTLPALTEKDDRDLAWAIDAGVDYVALSFVRTPGDVEQLRRRLRDRASDIGIIVKVEKIEALEHIRELIGLADGVMVARGDLGVETDLWQVPLIQKSIVAQCRQAGKPVIVATQMLQSMIANPMPTRAEVSDVANAILDGADAMMLSAETAAGQFPLSAVEMMTRVALATEAYQAQQFAAPDLHAEHAVAANRRLSAIAHGAVHAAMRLNARLVAVWSATGETVRHIARHRLPMPVVGLSHDDAVLRRMNLLFGVIPLHVEPLSNPVELARALDARLLGCGLARRDDLIIAVTSRHPTTPGETDTMLVHRVRG